MIDPRIQPPPPALPPLMPDPRVRLLDLFCGAGGAARGYQRAGFHVTGVDKRPQPRYAGDVFVQADAIEYVAANWWRFDAIHASPPCQVHSVTSVLPNVQAIGHIDLLPQTRFWLRTFDIPYIIENVVGAPLTGVVLCGLMFGLKVFRHRIFESNFMMLAPSHLAHRKHRIGFDGYCCVAGHGDAGRNVRVDAYHRRKSTWEIAMGIDWMTKYELTQAIPPAYTEYIGKQLMARVTGIRLMQVADSPRAWSAS